MTDTPDPRIEAVAKLMRAALNGTEDYVEDYANGGAVPGYWVILDGTYDFLQAAEEVLAGLDAIDEEHE